MIPCKYLRSLALNVILRSEATKNIGAEGFNSRLFHHPDTLRGVYTELGECAQGDIIVVLLGQSLSEARGKIRMRMARIISILLGVALLINIGIIGACSPTRQPVPTEQPMATLVIILADPEQRAAAFNYEGEFRPHTIRVAVGGMVTWNNTDNKDHTVISADGLFNIRLRYGESFNYTFSQNGTFRYHDKLYDGMDGIVYVE